MPKRPDSLLNDTKKCKTLVGEFDKNVIKVDGSYNFKGHILRSKNTNFVALKTEFLDNLIRNINSRYNKILVHTC